MKGPHLEVDGCALSIVDNVHVGGSNPLEGGGASALVTPVVDVHAGDDGVVGDVGVNGLLDECLEVGGDGALSELGDGHQVQVLGHDLLLLHALRQALLEDGELGVKGVVLALCVSIHERWVALELTESAD